MRNSDTPSGIVALGNADGIFRKPPYDEYQKNYEVNRDKWIILRSYKKSSKSIITILHIASNMRKKKINNSIDSYIF